MFRTRVKILFKLFSAVWRSDKIMRYRMALGFFLIFLASTASLVLPWCLKFIVDYLPSSHLLIVLVSLLVSYGIIWIISQTLINLCQIAVIRVFERGIHRFSYAIFSKLLNLPMSYHVHNATGGIMNAIERAQMAIPLVLFGLLFFIIPIIFEMITAVGIIGYYYGLSYAGILLALFAGYLIFTYLTLGWVFTAQRESNCQAKRVSTYITDILLNIESIHYQYGYKAVLKQCDNRMLDRENAVSQSFLRMDIVSIGRNIIAGLGMILLTVLVGLEVAQKKLVIGDFVLFNGYLMQFLIPLNILGTTVFRDMQENLTRMEDVMDILDQDTKELDNSSGKRLPAKPREIVFNQISFLYPDKKDHILKKINFSISAGTQVAIVGSNGSGKSTITKLLYRLYDPTEGHILIAGQDIREIRLSSLRTAIGIVPQRIFLLDDTIYANLIFGSDVLQDSKLFQEIMEITKIYQWVASLPRGYDTPVGEYGVKLSGGEKQRIGIARALLRKPKILVLDEATSALDVSTEHQILSYLHNSHPELTKLIITHDPRRLSEVDEVIYLRNGLIQAVGTHSDLLFTCSQYRELWLS